jgi:hypothetical protein
VTRFLERRAFRKIVDRVTAVQQLTRAAVDEADLRAIEVDTFQAAVNFDLFGVVAHAIALQRKNAHDTLSGVAGPAQRAAHAALARDHASSDSNPRGSFVMATETM